MTGAGTATDAAPVAAIDCGTNSTRLLVVDVSGRQLVRLMRITRLGKGVDASHRLDAASIERTLSVLREFREEMDIRGVGRARMAATSAVRDAANGAAFLEAAAAAAGVRAELLSGDEEGRLAFAGATVGLDRRAGADLVVDIGGGSTELVVGLDGSVAGVSLDLGCVRLTERCLHHDPPLGREIDEAGALIAAELDGAVRDLPLLDALPEGSRLIGLAGTVSTLSMLEQALSAYDWGRVHHSVLALDAVERWCETLAAEPAASRAARPAIVEGREDVIVGGALVLRAVMRRFGFDRCLVSETDILDGLAASVRVVDG